MTAFATVQDIIDRYGAMTLDEQTRAAVLIDDIESFLCVIAKKEERDLRAEVEADADFAQVAKVVTVDIVKRVMRQSTDGEPLSQESQSALGYSWSGTYAVPGGGIGQAIMRNDLKRLGLLRQRIGVYEPYATRDECNSN